MLKKGLLYTLIADLYQNHSLMPGEIQPIKNPRHENSTRAILQELNQTIGFPKFYSHSITLKILLV